MLTYKWGTIFTCEICAFYLVFVSISDIVHDTGQYHLLCLSNWLAYQVGVEPAMIIYIIFPWLDQNQLTSCTMIKYIYFHWLDQHLLTSCIRIEYIYFHWLDQNLLTSCIRRWHWSFADQQSPRSTSDSFFQGLRQSQPERRLLCLCIGYFGGEWRISAGMQI